MRMSDSFLDSSGEEMFFTSYVKSTLEIRNAMRVEKIAEDLS